MAMQQVTFGRVISDARKKLGLSQKELATRIQKDDGSAISAQYLNDIEHDRRNPPSDQMLKQLAALVNVNEDYLYYLAGQIPSDLRADGRGEKEVEAAMKAFRKRLKG